MTFIKINKHLLLREHVLEYISECRQRDKEADNEDNLFAISHRKHQER